MISVRRQAHRRRAQLGLLAAFIVLGGSLATLIVAPRLSRPVAVADVGTVAPDFELPSADGRTISLSSHRGHAVVLFFGSVRCPRTAEYQPRIEQLAREFSDDARVKFIALDETPDRSHELLLDPAIRNRGFPTLIDERGVVASRYAATDTPMFMVLDQFGVVRYRGPFDGNVDVAVTSNQFCANALREVLGTSNAVD